MPLIADDHISNALLGTVGTGRALYGLQLIKDVNSGRKFLDDWVSKAREASMGVKPVEMDGVKLRMSPEEADKLLSIYTENARKAAQLPIVGVPAGNLVNKVRAMEANYDILKKKLFGTAEEVDWMKKKKEGFNEHYSMFTNSKGSTQPLRTHMINSTFLQDHIDLNQDKMNEIRAAFDALDGEAKNVITGNSSIAAKHGLLRERGNKGGLDFVNKYLIGLADDVKDMPSAATYVGGGVAPNGAVRPGLVEAYAKGTKLPARIMKMLGAANVGTGVGLAGFSLYRELRKIFGNGGNGLLKKSATNDEDAYRLAQLGIAAPTAGVGGITGIEAVKELLHDLEKKKRYNVGFTYVHQPSSGEGHVTPSKNIRKILERGLEKLPDGHPLKGNVDMYNIPNLVNGMHANLARDYDLVYNTGLGMIPSLQGGPGAPEAEFKLDRDRAMDMAGKVKFLKNYQTDTAKAIPIGFGNLYANAYALGAAVTPMSNTHPSTGNNIYLNILRNLLPTNDVETIAYGNISKPTELLHNLTPLLPGSIVNHMPDGVGTPFIDADILESFDKGGTREELLKELEEAAAKIQPDAKMQAHHVKEIQDKIAQIIEDARNNKRIVSIAGSGRGDYVLNRATHLLDSADRLGLKNVSVVPLFAGYGGFKDLNQDDTYHMIHKLEKVDPRLKGMGRLPGNIYNLLQRISDVNMVSTGQMAASEAANSGNIQFLPEAWADSGGAARNWSSGFVRDLMLDKMDDPEFLKRIGGNKDYFKTEAPWVMLDDWNGGTIDTFPKEMPDVFKKLKLYDGDLRSGVADKLRAFGIADDTIKQVNQKIDTDPIVELLMDDKKLSAAKDAASNAAKANRGKVHEAQKMLFDRFVKTLEDSTSLKANLPRHLAPMLGSAGMLGLGGYGVYDAIASPITKLHKMLG